MMKYDRINFGRNKINYPPLNYHNFHDMNINLFYVHKNKNCFVINTFKKVMYIFKNTKANKKMIDLFELS